MRLLLSLISALVVLKKGRAGSALAPTSGRFDDDGKLSQRRPMGQGNQNQRLVLDVPPGLSLLHFIDGYINVLFSTTVSGLAHGASLVYARAAEMIVACS